MGKLNYEQLALTALDALLAGGLVIPQHYYDCVSLPACVVKRPYSIAFRANSQDVLIMSLENPCAIRINFNRIRCYTPACTATIRGDTVSDRRMSLCLLHCIKAISAYASAECRPKRPIRLTEVQ